MATSSVSKIVSQPRSLAEVCAALRAKLLAFLALHSNDETVQGTQRRARDAMEVIEEALRRYRYVVGLLSSSYSHSKLAS